MTTHLEQRLITVSEYEQMARSGILAKEERIELLNGTLIYMSPANPLHALIINNINALLIRKLTDDIALVSIQNPVRIPDLSEPEPDVTVIKPPKSNYVDRHPHPEDILLVIEVANTSLEKDKKIKLPIYAQAGIPEYWIVNIDKQEIEAYHTPAGDNYKFRELVKKDEMATIKSLNMPVDASKIFH